MFVTRENTCSRSSAFFEQLISNSYITGGTCSMDSPAMSNILTSTDRSIPSAVSCILCRSITAAESSLTGRGVLFTTTRKCHCSQLQERNGRSPMRRDALEGRRTLRGTHYSHDPFLVGN